MLRVPGICSPPTTYKVCKNIFYIDRPPGMYGVQKNFKFASVVFNGVLGPLLDEGEGHEVLLRLSAFTNIVKVIFSMPGPNCESEHIWHVYFPSTSLSLKKTG